MTSAGARDGGIWVVRSLIRRTAKVFQNREGVLPSEPTGYYHEYTVETPGSPDRGARRIVTAESGTDYYTSDHYATFDSIDSSC
jgi:ribonuclease T1